MFIFLSNKMFNCSHCSFHDGFKYVVDEHVYVAHGVHTDMTPRGKIHCPSTKLRVGPVGGGKPIKISTKVSVPPRYALQRGMGVEYENSESEHGDTDEEAVDEEDHDEETEQDEDTEMDEETARTR